MLIISNQIEITLGSLDNLKTGLAVVGFCDTAPELRSGDQSSSWGSHAYSYSILSAQYLSWLNLFE